MSSDCRRVRLVPLMARVALGSFAALAVLLIGGALPAFSSPASVGRGGLTVVRLTSGARSAARSGPTARRAFPLLVRNPVAYRQEKAAAERRYELWRQSHGLKPASPTIGPLTSVFNGLNAPGITDAATTGTPSDSTGAIGPSDYVEFINSEIAVYDNTDLSAPRTGETLDESTFVGDPTADTCDPQIQWDEQGQRWLYVALNCAYPHNRGAQTLYFGWSKTSDPSPLASNWCRYSLPTSHSLEDYPKLGHDDSQIIIGTNAFDDTTGNYTASHIFVLDKPANGVATCPNGSIEGGTAFEASTAASDFTPVPANIADSSATGYVAAACYPDPSPCTQLGLYTIGRVGGNNAVLGRTAVTVPAFGFPANVPQPGTNDVLDSSDTRLTQAVAITDPLTGKEGIWTQHTIDGGGPSVVRWYELTPGAATPTRSGTVSGPGGAFAFNGAISPTENGSGAVLDYNSGSASQLVDWRARDPLASTVDDIPLAKSGYEDSDFSCPSHPSTGGLSCRWGDYAAASPDPKNPCVAWGTSMLTVAAPDMGGTPQWGTQNAAIGTPSGACQVTAGVSKSGSGSGTVTSSPGGIDCGATCSHAYDAGTSVTLTAASATGSIFAGWSGDCSGTGSCNLTLDKAKSVTATFTVIAETLSVTTSGFGTVSSSPAGISCGSTCSHAFGYGTSVTLTATPATGSVFSGWSGACSGTGACTVGMTQATSVAATFSLRSETLTVAKFGRGSGRVGSSPAGISCGSTCSHAYAYGTGVGLTAKPAKGSHFAGWSGACSGKGTCSLTMSQARSVSAKFARNVICVVPKVKGKKLKVAKRILRKRHCRPGKITRRYSKVKKGRVIEQKPRAHRHLRKGAKVKLVVSKGKR